MEPTSTHTVYSARSSLSQCIIIECAKTHTTAIGINFFGMFDLFEAEVAAKELGIDLLLTALCVPSSSFRFDPR